MSLTDLSKENVYAKGKIAKQVPTRLALQSLTTDNKVIVPIKEKIDPLHEYSSEILNHLLKEEIAYKVSNSFLLNSEEINGKIRSILVDWLVSVHRRFKLLPETLFLTVNLIDRFLFIQETSRKELQLVGITALFLAAKYEEIYPPELRDLILLTDKAFTKDQTIVMERQILKTLDFQVTLPSSWRFFEKFSEGINEEGRSMGQYLLELSLVDEKMMEFEESLKAVAALYLAYRIFRKDYVYQCTLYSEDEVKKCAEEMLVLLQLAQTHPLTAVRDKFSKPQFHQVSTILLD